MQLPLWINRRVFGFVHGNNLVYNTCWEDPRLDRVALQLGPNDTILVITSAGCNALDYALLSPQKIHCVDMNPRQNSLLELKRAGIRKLSYADFFEMFGRGQSPRSNDLYLGVLRPELSPWAQKYWDKQIKWYRGGKGYSSFYFHGTTGFFAKMANYYIDKVARVRDKINQVLDCKTVAEQKELYDKHLKPAFWSKFVRWAVGRDSTLSLLGVPKSQRIQVEQDYAGGIVKFIEDSLDTVFTKLPIHDNYFWRVYLTGEYTKKCCPEYLSEEGFNKLKAGDVERIQIHTGSILDVLRRNELKISRYILLDHMDWLSSFNKEILRDEWQAIVDRAAPDCRVLYRSGGIKVDFVDPLEVQVRGETRRVGDLLTYQPELAAELHEKDRVHTYGSFYIGDLRT